MNYIGIDGGGTKTLFVLYDENGKVLDKVTFPSCHYLQVGAEKMSHILKQGIVQLTQNKNTPVAIGLGLAGYGQNQELVKKIDMVLMKTLNDYQYAVTSDAKIALLGALHGQAGMLVIAGTGSIMLATDGLKDYRVGGWGAHLGDEGSAYWIARRLLSIFTQQADGRLEKTMIYDLIHDGEKLTKDTELIAMLGQGVREKIAQIAKYAYQGAQEGDTYCLELYEEAGRELAKGLNVLSQKLRGTTIMASYAGGVFHAQKYLLEPLKKNLDSRIQLIEPMDPPEYGAYLLIKKKMEGEYAYD